MKIPKYRPPNHPGEILLKDFLEPLEISPTELAQAIHVSPQHINEIVTGKRPITPSTALQLAKFLGNSAEFWLNLQQNWELYQVFQEEAEDLNSILKFTRKEQVT
ncbi:HigA family addiction module antidote protein [Nostoc spongiaeforme FACHB-130]|uniref:HigA family addiction module antidote protein n=1 Tax=Nostoc spongiaeforme FACHB-130 TaxID=1357510 RepID=A0ABR8G1P6_9NOSO|nr:HigA family addiction module antitoxin [Nostoc spongiaeforme]MBD2597089.1 HigA family addiction module antidote protein [Nostoc spongiaeforme FACHB-130]